MNDRYSDTKELDGAAWRVVARASTGALFVGMLLGIGASALGRTDAARENAAPPTPYSAGHPKFTESAEPIATF